MKKNKKEIPIYCIKDFSNDAIQNLEFDIKVLEELVDNFEFINRPHRHDFYDILIITSGSGIHTIDFIEYEVKSCSIFFLTPGQVHSWKLSEDIKGFSIFFKSSFYLLDYNPKKLLDLPFFHSLNNVSLLNLDCMSNSFLKSILNEIVEENKLNKLGSEQIIRSYLDIFLIKLVRYYQPDFSNKKLSASTYTIRQLEYLIDTHIYEKRKPSDYAAILNITPKYLSMLCKSNLGKTPSKLINERLVLEAKRILTFSDLTISQIAFDLQFNDHSYFTRFFRQHTGQTPEKFRASILEIYPK